MEYLTDIFLFLQKGDALKEIEMYSIGASLPDSKADLPPSLKHQIDILKLILTQATECGYFIHSYTQTDGVGMYYFYIFLPL